VTFAEGDIVRLHVTKHKELYEDFDACVKGVNHEKDKLKVQMSLASVQTTMVGDASGVPRNTPCVLPIRGIWAHAWAGICRMLFLLHIVGKHNGSTCLSGGSPSLSNSSLNKNNTFVAFASDAGPADASTFLPISCDCFQHWHPGSSIPIIMGFAGRPIMLYGPKRNAMKTVDFTEASKKVPEAAPAASSAKAGETGATQQKNSGLF
jgi:hypothetical protein